MQWLADIIQESVRQKISLSRREDHICSATADDETLYRRVSHFILLVVIMSDSISIGNHPRSFTAVFFSVILNFANIVYTQ